MIIPYDVLIGNYTTEVEFTWDKNEVLVNGVCSVTYQDTIYVFGGTAYSYTLNQVNIVDGCELKRFDTLPFNAGFPSCGVFSKGFEKEIVLICFGDNGKDKNSTNCYSYDGDQSVLIDGSSQYTHIMSCPTLGNYNGMAFVTGGTESDYHSFNSKTELMYQTSSGVAWSKQEDYPHRVAGHAMVSLVDFGSVLVFGGHYNRPYGDEVNEYKPGNGRKDWNQIGSLITARATHSAIRSELHNNEIIIVGGTDRDDFDRPLYTEVWDISKKRSSQFNPKLDFYMTPVLASVHPGYCYK